MMQPNVLSVRDAETFRAFFVDFGMRGFGIGIARPGPALTWQGLAMFPRTMHAEALQRYSELETDVDVEDVIREWSDPDGATLVDFIAFMNMVDHQALGAGDLPQFVIPAEGLLRNIKPKRKAAARARAEKVVPTYVRRSFPRPDDAVPSDVGLLQLHEYDHIIVSFSGGKDSVACVLYLLELGVPPDRIELWHQCVDGRPGVDGRMWDWPCTESYCAAFAQAFGMRLLFQWKERGFFGEMTRYNQPTAPSSFQVPDGSVITTGGEGSAGTRLSWPAMAADLSTRWCSAYLKIDVAKKVFTNDPRFVGKRTLLLTGERRQESGNRARYADATDYSSTRTRIVHQWRAILPWFEEDVWEIMERFRVRPHPAYYTGWSRVSCLPCIFGDPNQWASVREIVPAVFERMAILENKFFIAARQVPEHPFAARPDYNGFLRRGESLPDAADKGVSYITPDAIPYVQLGLSEHYPPSLVLVGPGEPWALPKGAYGHSGGPT